MIGGRVSVALVHDLLILVEDIRYKVVLIRLLRLNSDESDKWSGVGKEGSFWCYLQERVSWMETGE